MIVGKQEKYEEAVNALTRIQEFEAGSLSREQELGSTLNFTGAVQPAELLIQLFNRLSTKALDDFPDANLEQVVQSSNNVYSLFNEVLNFAPDQTNPTSVRQSIIKKITEAYTPTFQDLHPLIAYSLHRSADFQRLDAEARATLQSVRDEAAGFSETMKSHETEAMGVLEQIRNVAAEEGVTQQALHFRQQATAYEEEAEKWQRRAYVFAVVLGGFAILTLFLHKIPFLKPLDAYETVQLGISKMTFPPQGRHAPYVVSGSFLGT